MNPLPQWGKWGPRCWTRRHHRQAPPTPPGSAIGPSYPNLPERCNSCEPLGPLELNNPFARSQPCERKSSTQSCARWCTALGRVSASGPIGPRRSRLVGRPRGRRHTKTPSAARCCLSSWRRTVGCTVGDCHDVQEQLWACRARHDSNEGCTLWLLTGEPNINGSLNRFRCIGDRTHSKRRKQRRHTAGEHA